MIKQKIANTVTRLVLHALDRTEVQNRLHRMLFDAANQLINNEALAKRAWQITNQRPDTPDFHWATQPNAIDEERYRIATREAAEYVTAHMPGVPSFANPLHLLNFCMDRLVMEGLILEFGVFSGTTINHLAHQTKRTVHGFDSFEGLPEQWGNAPAGEFDRQGKPPKTESNVKLHVGLFKDSLRPFLDQHDEPIALLHIDCDLYSSTRTVFEHLDRRIVPGTMIVFDEYFNYPAWRAHEHKAFQEFVRASGRRYEYLGYTNKGFSVAVKIF